MKKKIASILAILMLGTTLTACQQKQNVVDGDVTSSLDLEFASTLPTLPPLDTPTADWSEEIIETEGTSETESETTVTVIPENETTTETTTESTTEATTEELTKAETTAQSIVTSVMTEKVTEKPVTTTVAITSTATTEAKPIEIAGMQDIMNLEKNYGKKLVYNQLSERDKKIYKNLVNSVATFKATVDFGEPISEEDYHRIFCIAFYQNPELFWWSGTLMMNDDNTQGILAYVYSKEQATSYQKLIDKKTNALLGKLTTDMTTLQKVIICHNWICVNNVFSKESQNSKNVYGSIASGIAQCEGYAKGMLYLMNKIGVPCIVSTGSNKSGDSHAWVKVYINGEWTNIDPTFDDSVMEEPVDYTNVSYRYMGVPDVAIYDVTHFDVNTSPIEHSIKLFETPACTTYSLNADINYGNYAKTYEEAFEKLKSDCFKSVKAGKRCAHVKIATDSVYEETLNQLLTEKHILDIKKAINAEFGDKTITGIAISPKNALNYIEVTMTYGG